MTLYFIYDTCITSFYCRSVTTNRDSVPRVVWPLETMHWLTCWYVAWRVTCVLSSVLPKCSSFNWGFDISKCNALFYCLSCLCTLASAGFPKCPPPRLYLPTDMNPGTIALLDGFPATGGSRLWSTNYALAECFSRISVAGLAANELLFTSSPPRGFSPHFS